MNIYEALNLLKVKRNHLLLLDEADKGPGLYSSNLINKDPLLYAKIFSEGDKHLEAFLLKCFKNDISTRACCKGHNNVFKPPKKSYISFDDIDKNAKQLNLIMNTIYNHKEVAIAFDTVLDNEKENCIHKKVITLKFDKKLNKGVYSLLNNMLEKIIRLDDAIKHYELKQLYDICFNNNLDFIPSASITKGKDNSYILIFYNALLYSNKLYEDGFSNFYDNNDLEKRLVFNYNLSNLGFSKEYFIWYYKTDNNLDIINKLNAINNLANHQDLYQEVSVDQIVFFVNELTSYYKDYYGARLDIRFSCEDEYIILKVFMYEKDKSIVIPIYFKKMLYSEVFIESIYLKMINNYGVSSTNIFKEGNVTKIKYNDNQVMIDMKCNNTLVKR